MSTRISDISCLFIHAPMATNTVESKKKKLSKLLNT